MKYRKFGKTKFEASEVGLGCWQLGGDWGALSEKTADEILNTALECGVNFFDTADVYGAGRSESIIGKFLKSKSDDVFVATKVGRDGSLYPDKYTEENVRKSIEGSLQRLGVETLDLVQLHCIPTEIIQQDEIWECLRKLQKEGKIKEFGASVESMDEAMICMEQPDLCSLQIIFNIFRQKPVSQVLGVAGEKQVGIIVRLPLASGLLSGKFTQNTKFAKTDHRNYNRDGKAFNVGETFAGLPFEKGLDLVEGLHRFLPPGLSLAEMAIRWILDFEAVSTIIPGASRPEQVKQNTAISDYPPIDTSVHAQLKEFYNNEIKEFIRGPY